MTLPRYLLDRFWQGIRALVRLFRREPQMLRDQLRVLDTDRKPPEYRFTGHDDELRKATQARRAVAAADRKRAAGIDAGTTHESPRLRRVR